VANKKPPEATEEGAARLTGLPPLFDAQGTLLILGSFPSPASLRAQQYYGHQQNQFWKLLGAILDEPLAEWPYALRTERLRTHRIGIWDVYQTCIRPGALDADIRAGKANDFKWLLQNMPALRRLCFNGQTAARFAPQLLQRAAETGRTLEIHSLPSSSPAYTLPFAAKLERWQAAIRPLPA
jgi:hypoxanthine-DNA glycosylase